MKKVRLGLRATVDESRHHILLGENPKWFACLAGFVGLELTKTAKQNFTLGDETRHLKKLVQIIESTIPKMIDWYNCSILSAFLLLLVQNLPF